jgi:hypothetical protein
MLNIPLTGGRGFIGKMISKPLEDLFSFLSREEFLENMIIDPLSEE